MDNIIDSPFFLVKYGQITRIPDILHHRPTSIDLTLVSPNLAPLCYWKTWPDTLNSDHQPIITMIQYQNKQSPGQSSNQNINFNFKKQTGTNLVKT